MLTEEVPPRQTLPSESRRLDIQGLRAVAIILVVAFHAGLPVRGGFIGVDVFIVISGFVITGMLARELQSTGTVRFREFYSRRIKRLLPALALLTTTVVVLSVFLGSPFGSQQTTAKTGLGATFASANLVIYRDSIGYFAPQAKSNPLLHTWALSVEEQVYLVFPALLLGGWIVGRRLLRASKRGAVVMLALVAAASFVLSVLASFGRLSIPGLADSKQFAYYAPATRIWEFAIGAALALAAPSLKRIPPKVAAVAGVAGACAIGVGAFTISGVTPYPGFAALAPVLGAAAIITSGFRTSVGVPRLLAIGPMIWIGDLSYSWYLWHWPLPVFGKILWPTSSWILVALAVMSLVPARLSTVFLEDPIRRNRTLKGRRLVALAAVCTVIPTVACLGLAAGARNSWGNEQVAQMQTQVNALHVAETNQCDDAASASSIGEAGCEWNTSSRGPHVYLVGNSVAAMYSEALIGASDALDIPLTIDTSQGCFFSGGNTKRSCSDNFTTTVDKLVERVPGVVVMSSTWDLGSYGGNKGSNEKARLLVTSLTDAIDRLTKVGHHVLLVLPTPRFFHTSIPGRFAAFPDPSLPREEAHSSAWRPTDCSTIVAQGNPSSCGATVPEAQEDAAQATTMEALEEVAERTDSTTLDLRDRFCWGGLCRTNDGNRWMFEDGIHISVGQSRALAPTFAHLVRQIIRKYWGVPRAKSVWVQKSVSGGDPRRRGKREDGCDWEPRWGRRPCDPLLTHAAIPTLAGPK